MMSIKEQAVALVDEFYGLQSDKMNDYTWIEYPTAKLCALVVVKYVLEVLDPEDYNARTYWLEVQTEIEEKL
jgi:hypothetical protein